jgi:pimeloyl-ACP methyl ester carboxylesterase
MASLDRRRGTSRRAALAALPILFTLQGASPVKAETDLMRPALTPPSSTATLAERKVRHRSIDVDGVRVFYREAGPRDAPTLLLLHGFPSSSHMFRHLMPALADRWHVVAPDYPGFGASDFPDPVRFAYSFESYARLVDHFAQALRLQHYALYIQDYGAPVGLRLALRAPERVSALIVQNGNAYAEGLSREWEPLQAYWREPTPQRREQLRGWLGADGTRAQYSG